MAEKIMKTDDPKLHKKYGRQVSNFDPEVWGKRSIEIVKEGNVLKVLITVFTSDILQKEILPVCHQSKTISHRLTCIYSFKQVILHIKFPSFSIMCSELQVTSLKNTLYSMRTQNHSKMKCDCLLAPARQIQIP